MNLKPLGDRIVVKPEEEAESRTASGLVIPDTAKDKPQEGTVLAVGPGKIRDDGQCQPMTVALGNTVLFGKYAGIAIKLDGEELLVMRESDILGVLKR